MGADPVLVAFSGAVLAGGASSRMGTDKAMIQLGDARLVEIAANALSSAGARDVCVVGGDRAAIEGLGLAYVPDQFPGEGPLGGIITALENADADIVAVLACDHVATEGVAVRSIVGALGTADVAIPVVDGRRQVLHAAWRRAAAGHLRTAFADGERSVRAGIDGLQVVELLDGDPCWFGDADAPDDLPPGVTRPSGQVAPGRISTHEREVR